eukprot:COSAG01_NODE_29517_length_635_cov_4.007463_1_plen_62_part_10
MSETRAAAATDSEADRTVTSGASDGGGLIIEDSPGTSEREASEWAEAEESDERERRREREEY